MNTFNRLSWKIGRRPTPLPEYVITLRDMFDALLPVAQWDPEKGMYNLEDLTKEEQEEAFGNWLNDVVNRVSYLADKVEKLHKVRPSDSNLLDLHMTCVALGRSHAIYVGQTVDMLVYSGSDWSKYEKARKESQFHEDFIPKAVERLQSEIERLQRSNPSLLAALDLPNYLYPMED